MAEQYAERFRGELAGKPLDRVLLAAFAELVRGPVAEVGCGPGGVTGHLRGLGVDAFGIDLSPEMARVAQRANPAAGFVVGSMRELPVAESALGGLVAYYSVIHVPRELLPAVFTEFRRVLTPGSPALVVFQTGGEPLRITEAFDRAIDLEFHRHDPEDLADLLGASGIAVRARAVREAEGTELTSQAYLLAAAV